MKITYIHQHFSLPTEPGGQRPWEFTRRLAESGHEVEVICGGQQDTETTVEGVHIRRIAAPYDNAMSTRQRIASFLRFMARSTALAARLDTQLVFASSTPLTTAIPGIIGSVCQRVPFVFEVRDLWPSVPVQLGVLKNRLAISVAEVLEKVAYHAADQVIALSPGMAAGIEKVAPSASVTVIPNASDVKMFEFSRNKRASIRNQLGWQEDDIVLVYAGSFGITYDTPWILETAARLHEMSSRYKFVVCGEGADTNRLLALATRFGINVEEMLPGALPKVEVMRLLVGADFALSTLKDYPPLYVNSLNKVFDALAAATPVVFNHAGWLPSLLQDSGAGIRLPRDPQEAALAFHELMESGYERSRASQAALRLGTSQFDRDMLFARFRHVLESTAEDRAPHFIQTLKNRLLA